MKKELFLSGMLAIALAFVLLMTGCATSGAYITAAQKKDTQKMEQTLNKKGSDPSKILHDILISGGAKGRWNETNTIPAIELLIQKGADVNKTTRFSKEDFWDWFAGSTIYEEYTPLTAALQYHESKDGNSYEFFWSEPLLLEIVKCLLSHGADPNGRYLSFRDYSGGGLYENWWTALGLNKPKNNGIKALLIEHGALEGGEYVTWGNTMVSGGSSGSPASSPSVPSAPTFKEGRYTASDGGYDYALQFIDVMKQVTYSIDGVNYAQGSFSVSGNSVIIKYTQFYGDANARAALEGKTLVYTIINDRTISINGLAYSR